MKKLQTVLKKWEDIQSLPYKYYKYGFPTTYTWFTLFKITKLTTNTRIDLHKVLEKYLDYGTLPVYVWAIIVLNLDKDKKELFTTPGTYLCVFDKTHGSVHLCDWQHFEYFYLNAEFLFENEEHLSLAYIYVTCLHRGVFGANYTNDFISSKYCPNPCRPEYNPCKLKRNTKSDLCENADKNLLLYNNNYKCDCRLYYKWNQDKLECVTDDPCQDWVNPPCGDYKRSTKCELIRNHKAIRNKYEISVRCTCTMEYMGPACAEKRDACRENFYPELLIGYDACGEHGVCNPVIGTNDYACVCEEGWTDDSNNDYEDCDFKLDPCKFANCKYGYCKLLNYNKLGVCVCDDGFTGEKCDVRTDEWLEWGEWTKCTPTCGFDRVRYRERNCSNTYDDANAEYPTCYRVGSNAHFQYGDCTFVPCITEGKWTKWTDWSECNGDCGNRTMLRRRFCYFEDEGQFDTYQNPCIGPAIEQKYCDQIVSDFKCDSTAHASIIIFFMILLLGTVIFTNLKEYFDRKFQKVKNSV